MRFKLSFSVDNAAFEHAAEREIARILEQVARKVVHLGLVQGGIRDVNGNSIGQWEIVVDEITRLGEED